MISNIEVFQSISHPMSVTYTDILTVQLGACNHRGTPPNPFTPLSECTDIAKFEYQNLKNYSELNSSKAFKSKPTCKNGHKSNKFVLNFILGGRGTIFQ